MEAYLAKCIDRLDLIGCKASMTGKERRDRAWVFLEQIIGLQCLGQVEARGPTHHRCNLSRRERTQCQRPIVRRVNSRVPRIVVDATNVIITPVCSGQSAKVRGVPWNTAMLSAPVITQIVLRWRNGIVSERETK